MAPDKVFCLFFFYLKSADICHISAQKHMLWYSFEAPQQGMSNEFPQHMFSQRNIMWIPSLICSYETIIPANILVIL